MRYQKIMRFSVQFQKQSLLDNHSSTLKAKCENRFHSNDHQHNSFEETLAESRQESKKGENDFLSRKFLKFRQKINKSPMLRPTSFAGFQRIVPYRLFLHLEVCFVSTRSLAMSYYPRSILLSFLRFTARSTGSKSSLLFPIIDRKLTFPPK